MADQTYYVALGPNCWGQSTDRKQAVKNAAQNFPRHNGWKIKRPSDKHFSIFASASQMHVDEFGRVTSPTEITKLQTSVLADE